MGLVSDKFLRIWRYVIFGFEILSLLFGFIIFLKIFYSPNIITFEIMKVGIALTFFNLFLILSEILGNARRNIFKKKEVSNQLALASVMMARLNLTAYFPSFFELSQKNLESNAYSSSRMQDILTALRGGIGKSID